MYEISGEAPELVELKPVKEPINIPVELHKVGRPGEKRILRIMADWEVALEVWDAQPNGIVMAAEVPKVKREKKDDDREDKQEKEKNSDDDKSIRKNDDTFLP